MLNIKSNDRVELECIACINMCAHMCIDMHNMCVGVICLLWNTMQVVSVSIYIFFPLKSSNEK